MAVSYNPLLPKEVRGTFDTGLVIKTILGWIVSGLYLFEGVQKGNRASVGAHYDSLGILESQSNDSRMNDRGGNAAAAKKTKKT